MAPPRLEDAAEHLAEAIHIDPAHVLSLYRLGQVCESQERWDEAERYFMAAIDTPPEAAPCRQDFVTVLQQTREDCKVAEQRFIMSGEYGSMEGPTSPHFARSLVLHQRLQKFATLKAIHAQRQGAVDAGAGDGGERTDSGVSSMVGAAGASIQHFDLVARHQRNYLATFQESLGRQRGGTRRGGRGPGGGGRRGGKRAARSRKIKG